MAIDPTTAMDLAERGQKLAEHDIYSTLFVVLCGVVLAMGVYIAAIHRVSAMQKQRINDLRVEDQRSFVSQIADNLKRQGDTSTVVLLRLSQFESLLYEAHPKLRRFTPPDMPALGPEPKSVAR